MTPLADALGLDINDACLKLEDAKLARAAAEKGGVVLVAWEHEIIPAIVASFTPQPEAPRKWPGERFDMVWILDLVNGEWRFSQQPQMLLPGDRVEPIS